MRIIFLSVAIFLAAPKLTMFSASNTFLDYQNYNHGYCPDCNCCPCKCSAGCPPDDNECTTCPTPDPCSPPATSTCTECGLNICYVGIGIAIIAAAAAIIVSSDNGHDPAHAAIP